jgi:enolase
MHISTAHAQEILDSRGTPTVSCTVTLEDGSVGWAAVPSGASTGSGEALELRDGDPKRFGGKGVLTAVRNVNEQISGIIRGMDAEDQTAIDKKMIDADGTSNKGKFGANAILSVSLAVARAEAVSQKKPLYAYLTKFNPDFNGHYILPVPLMNVLNGGRHANWSTDIQEFMIIPKGASSFIHAMEMGVSTYQELKKLLIEKGYTTLVGDEGGFAPSVSSNEEPFELLAESVRRTGFSLGSDIMFGIDAAASEFFGENGLYNLKKERKQLSSFDVSEWYEHMMEKYPLSSLEDPFSEKDWIAFSGFTNKFGNSHQIIGDDLYVTNVKLLARGIEEKATNAILIKLNQIGTLSETIDAILLARKNGMASIVSHRSGETEDAFIADFVVAMGTGQIKTGAPARSERTAKYNRLLAIEQEVGQNSSFGK